MSRRVLLVEPNYRNKYPPIGLMKLATYYRTIGDNVRFFKGNLTDLVVEDTYFLLLEKLYANNPDVFWEKYKPAIINHLKIGKNEYLQSIPEACKDPILIYLFKYYRNHILKKHYFNPEHRLYDVVGITTLFTFYWDITIETINFAKQLCKPGGQVLVGGICASILSDEVEKATGIKPHVGTLSKPGILDDNDMVIDELSLDYSILEEIDYEYPATDAYYGYMTRGCINKCKFCAVPKLEPTYKEFLHVSQQVAFTENKFGGRKDLLLLDNNVLASDKFNEIVDEIKEAGFTRDSTFIGPNLYEIAVSNIRDGYNVRGHIRLVVKEYKKLVAHLKDKALDVYKILDDNWLLEDYTAKPDKVLATYGVLKPYFVEMYAKKKKPRQRYVDFNQGIDSRLITDANMEKLFEVPIRPLRIAFDHWNLRKTYEKAVRTAVKHGHTHLSNYVLYNFEDKPIELYQRLRLNVMLCEELGIAIYSFPMKYHPIDDPKWFSNRDYIGKYWNRKFIRTIQAVLNSTKGKVGRGKSFFEKAFGSNEAEFEKLLYMPESMIIYRLYFEEIGLTDEWWSVYSSTPKNKLSIAQKIIEKNDFDDYEQLVDDKDILKLLTYYRIERKVAEKALHIGDAN